jgi:hypothetical protein
MDVVLFVAKVVHNTKYCFAYDTTSQDGGLKVFIVALRENDDRPASYNSFSAKNCAFLAHGLGYISPSQYRT